MREFESSLSVVIKYYRERLKIYEQFDPEDCLRDELYELVSEASSMLKILFDFKEEGYNDFTDSINRKLNIFDRLRYFLDKTLPRLGDKSERELFCLYPETVHLSPDQYEFKKGNTFELKEYLIRLDRLANRQPDISQCFKDKQQMQLWLSKTDAVIAEISEYLFWIISRLHQSDNAVPLLLLRDTLLIYFGILWVERYGVKIDKPKPFFMSRKFIEAFSDNKYTYSNISTHLANAILHNDTLCDLTTLRNEFIKNAITDESIDNVFVKASRDYFESLNINGVPLIIESGIFGTFPLWLLGLNNNKGDFLLYSTAPWLYGVYRDILFRKNYNGLRDLETVVIHEHLFRFKKYCNGKVIIEETRNIIARNLALYELCLFKKLVMAKFKQLY